MQSFEQAELLASQIGTVSSQPPDTVASRSPTRPIPTGEAPREWPVRWSPSGWPYADARVRIRDLTYAGQIEPSTLDGLGPLYLVLAPPDSGAARR